MNFLTYFVIFLSNFASIAEVVLFWDVFANIHSLPSIHKSQENKIEKRKNGGYEDVKEERI